jgi:hypothetical protein
VVAVRDPFEQVTGVKASGTGVSKSGVLFAGNLSVQLASALNGCQR